MSKFDALWDYVEVQDSGTLTLTFEEVERIAGIPNDHSFLTFKQELLPRGRQVDKISLKHQTVRFSRPPEA